MSKQHSLPLLLLAMLLSTSAATSRAEDHWSVWADPSRVRAFALDGDAVWAGGRGGLVRITPATGDVEAVTTAEGLAGIDVMDLLMQDGELWVAMATEGLQRYRPGAADPWFRFQTFPQGLASDAVQCLAGGPAGGVWYGSDKGYGVIVDGQHQRLWNELNGLSNPDVRALAFAGDTLVVGTAAGLYRMDPGANPVAVAGAPTSTITDVAVVADSVWVVAGGALHRDRLAGTDAWQALALPVAGLEVKALAAVGEGLVVTLGESGTSGRADRVFLYSAGAGWTDISAGLPNNFYPAYSTLAYDAVLAGPGGDIWVGGTVDGALGPGAVHYAGGSWTHHPLNASPAGAEYNSMALAPSGNLWANSTVAGAMFDGQRWTRYPSGSFSGGVPRFSLDVLEDSQGWVWFNRYTHRFLRVELSSLTEEIITGDGVSITRMLEDAQGNRWFCRDNNDVQTGLSVFTADDTWIHYDLGSGLPSLTIDDIAFLSTRRVALLCRGAGLWIWDHAGTLDNTDDDTWWGEGAGLEDDDGLLEAGTLFSSLTDDRRGGLWVGQGNGLVRVVPSSGGYRVVTRLGAKTTFTDGLIGVSVACVAGAPDGSVWVGTDLGLTHAALTIENSGGQELLRWTLQSYTTETGRQQAGTDLFGSETLAPLPSGNVRRVLVGDDGDTIWLGTTSGVARLTFSPDAAPDPSLVDAAWIYPNPARLALGHQAVRLGGIEQPVTATVYNLEGQLVKESGEVQPGGVLWDMTTRFGSRAVSGTYILRLETQGHVALRELVVVR
ncbi:T9SS type A sorting domain-containing protein [bacterium]|nr:T9SS type A sorting domain-containing protein [bacterium]